MINKKAWCLIGFLLICYLTGSGQAFTQADSLELSYKSGNYDEDEELAILKKLAEDSNDPDKALTFSDALIKAANAADSPSYLCAGYFQKGNALRLKGNFTDALKCYFEAAKYQKNKTQGGSINVAIADIFSIMSDHNNAVDYYHRGISILKENKDSLELASALFNLGDEFLKAKNIDSAWINTKEAEKIFDKIKSDYGDAYCLGNLGIIYLRRGDEKKAEISLNKAIRKLESLEEYSAICEFLVSMSNIYLEKGRDSIAKNFAIRSLRLAQKYGLKEQISGANYKLSQFYEQGGDYRDALNYYKDYIIYRDSLKNIEAVQQMADMRTKFEVSKKQVQVDLLNQQKRTQHIIVISTVIALILIMLIALGLYRRNNFIKKTNLIIKEEQKRSENLLLNILPEKTAGELKKTGKVLAQKFDSVTVLFTDFKGFTAYAENLLPEQVVESVDYYFSKFDEIIEKYGLEKIKTIGDSYMCAGGLPYPTNDHAFKMIKAAFEITSFVKHTKELPEKNRHSFDIRIGISTGPVVAGVVGSKKFAYDIWGDTVNIASRMESNSEPGKINVSEATYILIKDKFTCEYRGEIKVKNRGLMKMYFINKAI